MTRRTKTYIAGDWDHDIELIDELYRRNNNDYYALHFVDAHDLTQARDTDLPCSIKKSLATRMDASKTFVLIVGDHTCALTKGSCQHCRRYSYGRCLGGQLISRTSFIEYECNKAVRDGLDIIVLYNSTSVDRSKCPETVRWLGQHEPAYDYVYRRGRVLRYQTIRRLLS